MFLENVQPVHDALNNKHNCLETKTLNRPCLVTPFKRFLNKNNLSQKLFQVCSTVMSSSKLAGITFGYMLLCLERQGSVGKTPLKIMRSTCTLQSCYSFCHSYVELCSGCYTLVASHQRSRQLQWEREKPTHRPFLEKQNKVKIYRSS